MVILRRCLLMIGCLLLFSSVVANAEIHSVDTLRFFKSEYVQPISRDLRYYSRYFIKERGGYLFPELIFVNGLYNLQDDQVKIQFIIHGADDSWKNEIEGMATTKSYWKKAMFVPTNGWEIAKYPVGIYWAKLIWRGDVTSEFQFEVISEQEVLQKSLVMIQGKNFSEAIARLDSILTATNKTSVEALELRAQAYLGLKKYLLALTDANSAIQLRSNDTTAYFSRAQAYEGLEKYSEAITDYTKAVAISPDLIEARMGLERVQSRYTEQQRQQELIKKQQLEENERRARERQEELERRKAQYEQRKKEGYQAKKSVGMKVAFDGTWFLGLNITITGFVEGVNNNKIQIRIVDTQSANPSYNGVTLYKDTIIWDEYTNWYIVEDK